MVLVENKVNDRRDRQIQEAIDVRNWKQALSLCERRLKRGEKSDHLSVCSCCLHSSRCAVARRATTVDQSTQVLKARVLLSFSESPRQNQGRDDISALLQRDPPITDVQALVILQECLQQIGATDAEVDLIWERAVRLRPHEEELQTLWFRKNFEAQKWKGSQKVCYSILLLELLCDAKVSHERHRWLYRRTFRRQDNTFTGPSSPTIWLQIPLQHRTWIDDSSEAWHTSCFQRLPPTFLQIL